MDFSALDQRLDTLGEEYGIPACGLVLRRRHEELYRRFPAGPGGDRLTGADRCWLYSATKLATVTAALQLVERGLLHPDDPVSAYVPAFGALRVRRGRAAVPARKVLTVRHLFTMTGGMNYDLDVPELREAAAQCDGRDDTRRIVSAMARIPLDFEPGAHFQYSLCHDVLGAVVEAVSGMRLRDYMQANIFGPLGMRDTGFTAEEGRGARFATQYRFDEARGAAFPAGQGNVFRFTSGYDSGGAGLCGTADDYILLLDALACGGAGASGARILLPGTVRRMRENQLSGTPLRDFQLLNPEYGYGLGVRTRLERGGAKSPRGEFGWDGAAGAYALCDAAQGLSVFYLQQTLGCGFVFSEVHPRLRDLVYEALEQ